MKAFDSQVINIDETQYKLKKLIKLLEAKKGRHTELVTVYVPVGYSLYEITNQLRQEQGTAENIKSKPVRKNVVSALEKIMRHFQLYKQTPEHGLAVFCGNVSEKDGESDIELWAIEPPEPVKVKMYWCDQKFDVGPLMQMIAEKDIYGIVVLDKSEANVALIKGKKIENIAHFDSIVPGKSRAGGQSSARFARVREGLLNDFLKEVGDATNKAFLGKDEIRGIMIAGPGPIKEYFINENYLDNNVSKKIIGTVDTGSTGEPGIHEALNRGEHLIKEAHIVKEKKILQDFFSNLKKGDLVAYGLREVIKAVEMGAVQTLIVSEVALFSEVEYKCKCGFKKDFLRNDKRVCRVCGENVRIIGEKDLIESVTELAKNYSTNVEIVSGDTPEGQQFLELGGIGAILRYKI